VAEDVEKDIDALLEDTKRERDEYLALAQRTRADFENYRKRMAAEAQAAGTRGKAELAGQLIDVIDNLERALAATEIDAAAALDGELSVEGPLEQGIVLTYRELSQALGRAGVEVYDPRGERFDPSWHEALQTRADEAAEPGTVVEVLQRGYRLDGQVLRPARVVVSE
jgi:molecular chaperone GrpE